MSDFNNVLHETIHHLFVNNERGLQDQLNKHRHAESAPREFEIALTVLLVELASSDQHFDTKEYRTIAQGLRRVFGTSITDIKALVNRATLALSNFESAEKFASILGTKLDLEKRHLIMEVIDEVILADGVTDEFEIYLRAKFARLLKLENLQAKPLSPGAVAPTTLPPLKGSAHFGPKD